VIQSSGQLVNWSSGQVVNQIEGTKHKQRNTKNNFQNTFLIVFFLVKYKLKFFRLLKNFFCIKNLEKMHFSFLSLFFSFYSNFFKKNEFL
jgi:hypothetical protein